MRRGERVHAPKILKVHRPITVTADCPSRDDCLLGPTIEQEDVARVPVFSSTHQAQFDHLSILLGTSN